MFDRSPPACRGASSIYLAGYRLFARQAHLERGGWARRASVVKKMFDRSPPRGQRRLKKLGWWSGLCKGLIPQSRCPLGGSLCSAAAVPHK